MTEERRSLGRSKIDSRERQSSHSTRAERGKLDVIERRCKYCGHHKALKSKIWIKCSRYKRFLEVY